MKWTRRTIAFALVVVFGVGYVPKMQAQGPATAGAAVLAAKSVLDKLNDILVGLTGDAQIAVGGATQQFSDLISQVQDVAKDEVATPINNLSANVRVAINNLQEVTSSFNALVSKQRECIFAHLDLFVAGVQTVATGIKVLGFNVVSADSPRLIDFIFDGQITPNIVPKAGGEAVVKGVLLWTAADYPPTVKVQTADRTIIAQPQPEHATGENDFRVPIPSTLIAGLGGKCLYLDVTTFKKNTFLGITTGKQQTGEMTLPMCIPQEYDQSLSLQAHLSYSVTAQGERSLSGRRFGFSNSSCEDRHNVSHTEAWDAEIPAGWRIVRVQQSAPDVVNQSNIGISNTAKSVTAAGWLDTASCIITPFSHSLLHDTHWNMTLTPVADGPNTNTSETSSSTTPQPMSFPETKLCTDIPKDSSASGASTFWITLTPYLRGEQQPNPLYVGPRKTDPDANEFTYSDQSGGYEIKASYNPTVISGKSQVCATVTVQGTCAW
ncbi:MAG: hypothetical protein ABSA78_09025 [Candidatus Sulfotelmatobacter sp.]